MDFRKIIEKYKSSDIFQRIFKGAFWSFFGSATGKLIVLVSGIICAHILTKVEYGQYGMIRSTISMFVVMGSAGLGLTAARHISELRAYDKSKIPSIYLLTNGFAFVTGTIVTLLVLLAAPFIATNILKSPELVTPLRVGAFLLFVTVINAAQNGTLTGFEDFKSIGINVFIGSLSEAVFMLLGAKIWGVTGAVLGYGTGYLVIYLFNNWAIRKNLRKADLHISFKDFDRRDLKLLYTFSLPAALSSLLVTPVLWSVRTILVNNSDFAELASYEAAEQWRVIILFIPMSVSQVVLPLLSSSNNNKKKYRYVLKVNLLLNLTIATAIAFLVIVLSPIITSLYGESYTNPYPLIILAASTIFTTINNVVGHSISSRSKMWQGFTFNSIWAIVLITSTYFFVVVKNMGATGLSLSLLIAYSIHCIIESTYLYGVLKKEL